MVSCCASTNSSPDPMAFRVFSSCFLSSKTCVDTVAAMAGFYIETPRRAWKKTLQARRASSGSSKKKALQ